MNINKQTIDWNSSDVLMQIAYSIQNSLNPIIEANKRIIKKKLTNDSQKNLNEIIISNSQEIVSLIQEVLKVAKSKSIRISSKPEPIIFEIYNSNLYIKSICGEKINLKILFKSEIDWLLIFEEEIFKRVKDSQLNLFDLSFYMAMGERQLHRRIKNILGITPNKYIRILKLHKAKKLLDNYTYNTVSEVSYAVGYNDTHYFSKLFYQQYNITPKELIRSMR